MSRSRLRLGIDVGGTFTDVVAIDAGTRELVASLKVPTTHDAPEGVAAGIIAGIRKLFEEHGVAAQDVGFIAHSTTQATNALLEGDVARVGMLGLLDGLAPLARMQMRVPAFDLAPGVSLQPLYAFAKNANGSVERAVGALRNGGAQAVAISAAFSVDHPQDEERAAHIARESGLYATCGHEMTSMYGLRARTRTTILNAAILPKMIGTARMTADATAQAAIAVPLMIMRSDGGVMDVREMERRPILTLLSGPADGVAGALLHENVTDGIFIEVGGTSSDCSAIRAGTPQMRPARVGGHRTMLRTLDVRTLAIAGGSMPRVGAHGIIDVGPRSAHIAGCKYASFVDPATLSNARVQLVQPTPHDPADYATIVCADGARVSVTPTCASNMLGYVPQGAFATGNPLAARRAFEILANHLHADCDELARSLLAIAGAKLEAAIQELIADYDLDRSTLTIVGGGGGAAALVPFAAEHAKLPFRIARDAEVISPVGVALALVREVVERTVVNPQPADILRIRRDAQDAVVAAGAAPESVEVSVEIDTQRNIVRAAASGAAEIAESSSLRRLNDGELLEAAAALMRANANDVRALGATPLLTAFCVQTQARSDLRVLDRSGVARLALRGAIVHETSAGALDADLAAIVESQTTFGDVGRALPQIFIIHGARIADFSGLATAAQAVALAHEEVAVREPAETVLIVTSRRIA